MTTAGIIGRWKPLHIGGHRVLEALCSKYDHLIIGIGSCNKYNERNPFTPEETADMIKLSLPQFDNYEFRFIPDFGHIPEYADGRRWKQEMLEKFGPLDVFFTGNPYVATLLNDSYRVEHPSSVLFKDQWMKVRSSEVRQAMARYEAWEHLVPEPVVSYIKNKKLDERFRREFGLEIMVQPVAPEDMITEIAHVRTHDNNR